MFYFNNAATSNPKPKEVIDSVLSVLNCSSNPGRSLSSLKNGEDLIFEARNELTKFFNGDKSSNLVFTSNATESLNIIIKGIFNKGDHIITTVLEHNSVLRPLYEINSEKECELSFIDCDNLGNINYKDIEKNIKSNTKAFICTHSSNVTGNVFDIDKIGRICKSKNILFILDASQSAGIIPIDVKASNVDILCFTGHKSLYGPQGIGGIYINNDNIYIHPLKSGGTGIKTFDKKQPFELPTHLEAGTLNLPGIAGLLAGVKFINKIGIDNIRKHELMLMRHFYDGIKNLNKIKIYGDFSKANRTPLVTFNIGDYSSGDIEEYLLDKFNISIRSGGHCAPLVHTAFKTEKQGAVRFSFSYFNTLKEIDYAINAIKTIF